jgi:hypothetical protein
MMRSTSVSYLGSEFDEFLFAPIGEDRNGMLLSVLSALARLDVDPWQEAAKLAGLPGKNATERLASLIAALPDEPSAHRDPGTIAARLTALLPRRTGLNIASRDTFLGVGVATNSRTVISAIAINIIFVVIVMGAQWIVATRQLPVQAEHASAPLSRTVSPQAPRPNSGH